MYVRVVSPQQQLHNVDSLSKLYTCTMYMLCSYSPSHPLLISSLLPFPPSLPPLPIVSPLRSLHLSAHLQDPLVIVIMRKKRLQSLVEWLVQLLTKRIYTYPLRYQPVGRPGSTDAVRLQLLRPERNLGEISDQGGDSMYPVYV